MRLLLWVLFVTLATFLASTDAVSSKIAKADTNKASKLGSIQAPLVPTRALSPVYIVGGKRGLRVNDNEDADEPYTDEERALSISSFIKAMKNAVEKPFKSMLNSLSKRLAKAMDNKAMDIYKTGVTPAMYKASRGESKGAAYYTEWYNKNVAAGVIKALD